MIQLLVFPHSHYCEKARWALDHKKVPFQEKAIMPGLHLLTVSRLASSTSVPVLIRDGEAIQGSTQTIDFLEHHYPEAPLTPCDPEQLQTCTQIEQQEDALGENLRRILYHKLLNYPAFIRHCFTYPMPRAKQIFFTLFYPVLRRKIYQTYVISDQEVDLAKKNFNLAMNEMASRLEGRQYLVGDQFSRADLSVASMLSLLALPAEHPFPWQDIPDKDIRDFYSEYHDHPVTAWVKTMYREHR